MRISFLWKGKSMQVCFAPFVDKRADGSQSCVTPRQRMPYLRTRLYLPRNAQLADCMTLLVRSGVLRGVCERQHQRNADLRAPRRPHLRQDVQEPGRQHDGAQQPTDEAFDGSAGWRWRRSRARRSTESAAVPAVLVGTGVAWLFAIRRASSFTLGIF